MARRHSSSAAVITTHRNPGTNGMQQPASKKDAVRMALAAGVKSPTDIAQYVKDKFALDMSVPHVNTVKGQLKREKNEKKPKGKPGRKPGRPRTRAVEATPARAEARRGLTVAEVRTLKELVGRVGGVGGLQPYLELLEP